MRLQGGQGLIWLGQSERIPACELWNTPSRGLRFVCWRHSNNAFHAFHFFGIDMGKGNKKIRITPEKEVQ